MSSSGYIRLPVSGGGGGSSSWKDPVDTFASLPASDNTTGDVRITLDTLLIYIWDVSAWEITGTPAFDFSSLPGYYFDLDPGDASSFPGGVFPTTGSSIATIYDKATSYQLQQSTGANQPVWNSSGFGTKSKPYLSFNGTTQFLQSTTNFDGTNLTGDPLFTAFLVMKPASTAADIYPMGWGASSTLTESGPWLAASGNYRWGFGANDAVSTTPFTTNAVIFTARKFSAGAIDTTMDLRINGALLTLGASSSSTPNVSSGKITIGAWTGYTTQPFNGKFARIIIYNGVLTPIQINTALAALNGIYGIY